MQQPKQFVSNPFEDPNKLLQTFSSSLHVVSHFLRFFGLILILRVFIDREKWSPGTKELVNTEINTTAAREPPSN